jgi:hypothetical protein
MPQLDQTILHGSLSRFLNDIDDWCPTRPHRKFPPKGPGVRDVLVGIAIHNLAEEISDPKARGEIQGLAGVLFQNGGRSISH